MRKYCLIAILFIFQQALLGQDLADSILNLREVVIRSYFTPQPLLRSPSSAFVINNSLIKQQSGNSMVPVLNIVPGVRMEERSPGSYRLSIRGSSIRSPFGVRNIKIYLDEIPLTDASGNTYLNFLDINTISGIEVLKGPDGSLFGANSGGVVLFSLFDKSSDNITNSADISTGSYGLIHEMLTIKKSEKNYHLKISQSYLRSDGYRANSALKRNFLQTEQRWNYSPKNEIRALLFYSDYSYSTPGGLTLSQMETDPTSARPATSSMPGAIDQHASVRNQILSGGLIHEAKFSDKFRHVISLFGSHVNFGNISIANIESTTNNNFGFRTYIELTGKKETNLRWQWDAGLEGQKTMANISNFGNNRGLQDTIQAANRLNVQQYFFFTRFHADIFDRLTFETAISLNNYQYKFGPINSTSTLTMRKFKPQIMPKVALSYTLTNNISLRASVSRGFSPPTIDEIRSSDNVINTELQPENGLNYETGIRFRNKKDRFWLDVLIFNYKLHDAIVRRLNSNSTEYFVNVGGTQQIGFESSLSAWIVEPNSLGFLRGLQLHNSFTLSKFTFVNYQQVSNDFSG